MEEKNKNISLFNKDYSLYKFLKKPDHNLKLNRKYSLLLLLLHILFYFDTI